MGLVKVYVRELSRLQAQELLSQANAVALGSGTMREYDQRKLRNQLIKRAGQQQQKAPASVRHAVISGMGIKVIRRG